MSIVMKKNKAGKGMVVPGKEEFAIFNMKDWAGFTEKVIFEQRPEKSKVRVGVRELNR